MQLINNPHLNMNATEKQLATNILNAAAISATKDKAGDTLLFVQAYSMLVEAASTSVRSLALWQKNEVESEVSIKDCTFTGGATAINSADSSGSASPVVMDLAFGDKTLPDFGEPTPIQPIPAPAKRTRRTQAQIESDNAAAAAAPVAEPTPEPATAETPVQDLPSDFDGVALSTLFKDINSAKVGEDKAAFITAVKAKLAEIGAPAVSKVAAEFIADFRTFLLSFKA